MIDYIILCFKLSLFYSFKKIAFDFYYFLCSALITPVSNDFCLKKEAYAQPKQTFASNMFCWRRSSFGRMIYDSSQKLERKENGMTTAGSINIYFFAHGIILRADLQLRPLSLFSDFAACLLCFAKNLFNILVRKLPIKSHFDPFFFIYSSNPFFSIYILCYFLPRLWFKVLDSKKMF